MQSFFENLDMQLRGERGPNGEPSSYDFQSHELFKIVERFAEDWDRLPQQVWSLPMGDRGTFGEAKLQFATKSQNVAVVGQLLKPPTCGGGRCEPQASNSGFGEAEYVGAEGLEPPTLSV